MGLNRWDPADLWRLLMAAAFLIASKALLGTTPLWDALQAAGGVGLCAMGLLLVIECVTRWLGVREGSPRTGPPKTG